MNRKKLISLLTVATILTGSSSVLAAPYTIVDDNGKVHEYEYSDFADESKVQDFKDVFSKISNLENFYLDTDEDGMAVTLQEAMGRDTSISFDKFEKDNAKVDLKDVVKPVEGELEVQSVTAINARHLAVTFNNELDSASAVIKNNYTVTKNTVKDGYGHPGDALVNGLYLMKDKKTVVFELKSDLDNGDKYSIDVTTGVKDANGNNAVRYGDTQKVFKDYEKPQIEKAELKGNKIVLYYNEPISFMAKENAKDLFEVKVDGREITKYTDKTAEKNPSNVTTNTVYVPVAGSNPENLYEDIQYTVTIDVDAMGNADTTKLIAEKGEHNVVIYNARDIVANNGNGGNKVQMDKASYVIKEDVESNIEVVDIKSVDFNSLNVEFNKEPKFAKVVVTKGDTVFYEKNVMDDGNTGVNANIHLPYTVQSEKDGLTYLYEKDAKTSDVKVSVVEYYDENKNYGKKYETNITLERENVAPAAKGQIYNELDENGLKVKLNEDEILDKKVGTLKLDSKKVRVFDKDGIERTVKTASNSVDENTVVITIKDIDKDKNGATITDPELLKKAYEALAPYKVVFDERALSIETDLINVESPKYDKDNQNAKYVANDTTAKLENKKFETVVNAKGAINPEDPKAKYVEGVQNVKGPKVLASEAVNNPLTNAAFKENDNGIQVTYKYKMDKSAADIKNYKLDNVAFPEGTYISMDGTSKIVTIILPKETQLKNEDLKLTITKDVRTANNEIVVNNVANNEEEYMSEVFTVIDNVAPTMVDAKSVVKSTDEKMSKVIEVTLSEELDQSSTLSEKNFEFIPTNGSVAIKVTKVEYKKDDNGKNTMLTVTLADDINVSNGGRLNIVPKSESGEEQTIKDMQENFISEEATVDVIGKIVDKNASDSANQDQVKADEVKGLITNANTQADIEDARDKFNALTAEQQALVDNKTALETKEQGLADNCNVSVTSAYTVANAGTKVSVDSVTGFTFEIVESSEPTVIDNDGTIMTDGTANLKVKVTHTKSGKTAEKSVSVIVNL